MTTQRISLEITINVVLEAGEDGKWNTNLLDWQFDASPQEMFKHLSPVARAELWRSLRDEIEEYWLSTALYASPEAAWNWRLEDVNLE
ncbi:MAG: hypothetical protein GYB65_00775 [Chloroflexi bacterium]|nr:hypothetical protein [Chloroflexota bacterium]